MAHADFIHLRVHSAFSLSEGAIHIDKLADLCLDEKMPAVAITDTNNLFGALEFSEAMYAEGIQPIVGATLSLSKREKPSGNGVSHHEVDQITLLVQNLDGYRNLIKLISDAYNGDAHGSVPQLSLDALKDQTNGLICLSGGVNGPLGWRLLQGQKPEARELARDFMSMFPGNFYIELQRHGLDSQKILEPMLLEMAYELDIPIVATNDVHFSTKSMFGAHDALICIAQRVVVAQADRRSLTPEHYFKSAEEMKRLFIDLPEAIYNTVVIARRCAFKVNTQNPILPQFDDGTARSQKEILRDMAVMGLRDRLDGSVPESGSNKIIKENHKEVELYWARLQFELDTIIRMGFSGYFLIVADIIQWSKKNNIPVGPGRGSGAGSLVAWALKITDLDPLRFSLLFERFLNPDRVSMPDFDIDFCQEKRDQVIRYVQDRYGHDHVAQIITFGKLQARAVLRDVGRVLDLPFGLIDRLCKLVPINPSNPLTLQDALDQEPLLRTAINAEQGVDRLFEIALSLEGLYRHASTHAAGVVIGDRPLNETIPLYRDPNSEMPVTQFNMKWVESAGLVKFDFLGLKTLTVLDRAVDLIKKLVPNFALEDIPLNDCETYKLISAGETIGVFQLEGSGMREMLRQIRPDTFEDIIAVVALYRPGPMDNIPRFIAVKHGSEEPDYLHVHLEPILRETYGVIVYQEQVMQIAQVLAGYSLGEADLLRRAMGKKIRSEMDAQRERFVNGAVENGVELDRANFIFNLVNKFAGYGFNKSHAAAYALIAYQTAYLKCNFPIEFMAASMTLDMNNTDKLNMFKQETKRMNICVLPPDVNSSGVEFEVERVSGGVSSIRYALAAVKNVGREAMKFVAKERAERGKFSDIWDFVSRIDPQYVSKRPIENLARAGAFDILACNRAQLVHSSDLLIRFSNKAMHDRNSNQEDLFSNGGGYVSLPNLPAVDDWNSSQKLSNEFDALGLYLSAHPLDSYASVMHRKDVVNYAELLERFSNGGTHFQIAGTILRVQERKNSRNLSYAFVQLSDQTGMFEIMVFTAELLANRSLLQAGQSILVIADARTDGDSPKLIARKISNIDDVSLQAGTDLNIYISDIESLASLRQILNSCRPGTSRVSIFLTLLEDRKEVEVGIPRVFSFTAADRSAIKAIPGIIDVKDN